MPQLAIKAASVTGQFVAAVALGYAVAKAGEAATFWYIRRLNKQAPPDAAPAAAA